uniref:5-hydroxytryptamine receptor 3A-like isoform X2 n=1 Tax=Myxine glutinosa TaxID=7769 RepID=UPI00358E223E
MECVLLLLLSIASHGLAYTDATEDFPMAMLAKELLTNYSNEVLPVANWKSSLTVYLNISITSILNLDEMNYRLSMYLLFTQGWYDYHLQWDPVMHDGITHMSLPANEIWYPDLIIDEIVSKQEPSRPPFVLVNASGWVDNSKPLLISSTCSGMLQSFPFDEHVCSLSFRSALHTSDDIKLALMGMSKEVPKHLSGSTMGDQWILESVKAEWAQVFVQNDFFDRYHFHIEIRRRPFLHVINLIIPSAFMILIDLTGFLLPNDCGQRVIYKTTLLLSYGMYLNIIVTSLPPTALSLPLIDIYYVVAMVWLGLSLSESIRMVQLTYDYDKQFKMKTSSPSSDGCFFMGCFLGYFSLKKDATHLKSKTLHGSELTDLERDKLVSEMVNKKDTSFVNFYLVILFVLIIVVTTMWIMWYFD